MNFSINYHTNNGNDIEFDVEVFGSPNCGLITDIYYKGKKIREYDWETNAEYLEHLTELDCVNYYQVYAFEPTLFEVKKVAYGIGVNYGDERWSLINRYCGEYFDLEQTYKDYLECNMGSWSPVWSLSEFFSKIASGEIANGVIEMIMEEKDR